MKNRRGRTRLIKPELQTQAIFVSLTFAKIAVALTCATIYFSMRGKLAEHPKLLDSFPNVLGVASFVAMCVLTPILLAYVSYATHRVAGPAYRMEQYLKAYLRGEEQGRLTLREKDELQVLANLLDMALAKKDAKAASAALTGPLATDSSTTEQATPIDPDSVPGLLPQADTTSAPIDDVAA